MAADVEDVRTPVKECGTCGYPTLRKGGHAPFCIDGVFIANLPRERVYDYVKPEGMCRDRNCRQDVWEDSVYCWWHKGDGTTGRTSP